MDSDVTPCLFKVIDGLCEHAIRFATIRSPPRAGFPYENRDATHRTLDELRPREKAIADVQEKYGRIEKNSDRPQLGAVAVRALVIILDGH
jgi:hypothetical protein